MCVSGPPLWVVVTMSDEYTPTMEQWVGSFERFMIRHEVDDPEGLVEELRRVVAQHESAILAQSSSPREVRVLVTHPHDGHREGETCLECAPEVTVEDVAQFIRTTDGNHAMGAGALAEALLSRFNVTERKEQ